jgi:hypothetical protein
MNGLQLAFTRFLFMNGFALIFYVAFSLFLNSWLAFFAVMNFMYWLYPVIIKDVVEFEPQIIKGFVFAKNLVIETWVWFKELN